jgi:hypothetical protein
MIHVFGSGLHHHRQKEEVANALSTLIAEAADFEPASSAGGVILSQTIMSNDTALHCVPTTEGDGDYILQSTDLTINSKAQDELEPSEARPNPSELNTSEAGTRELASSSVGSGSIAGRENQVQRNFSRKSSCTNQPVSQGPEAQLSSEGDAG